jgi:hypothetical protein
MAVNKLESLVLRGVSVLCDGRAVELCLGASTAARQIPEVRISQRHPSPGYPQANPNPHAGGQNRDVKRVMDKPAFGAGRSRGLAGSLSRRSPAITAGVTAPSGWSTPVRPVVSEVDTNLLQAWCWRRESRWSPEAPQATATRSPFTGATSFTPSAVLASTRGT